MQPIASDKPGKMQSQGKHTSPGDGESSTEKTGSRDPDKKSRRGRVRERDRTTADKQQEG